MPKIQFFSCLQLFDNCSNGTFVGQFCLSIFASKFGIVPTEVNSISSAVQDSLSEQEMGSFGTITLAASHDTIAEIDFPMQRGETVVPISQQEDEEVSAIQSDTTKELVEFIPQKTEKDTITLEQDSVLVESHDFAEFEESFLRINYTKVGEIENGWAFWTILASIICFAILKLTYVARMSGIFSIIFNYNKAQKEFAKEIERSRLVVVITQTLFAVNVGLLAFFAFQYYLQWDFSQMKSLGITFMFSAIVIVLYLLKKLLFLVVAHIFDNVDYARECNFNINLFNRGLCICLYPVVIALAFVKPSVVSTNTILIIGYVVCGLMYVLRILREIKISLKNHISFFYIFLYFCMLEILPLMILVKVITSIVFVEFGIL